MRLTLRTGLVSAIAGAALTFGAVTGPAAAVDFSGKKITILVPFKEGGGADVYGRIWQPFLEKHLEGNPTVIVRNEPGGGSIKAANKFQEGPTDGSVVMTVSTSTMVNGLLAGDQVRFNPLDWEPIILSPLGAIFYTNASTGATGEDVLKDIEALKKAGIVYGSKSPTASEMRGVFGMELIGITDYKVIFGLSTGEQRKAVLSNELNFNYDTASSYRKKVLPLVEDGKIVPVLTMGYATPDGEIQRDPAHPDKPTFLEVYKMQNDGKAPTGKVADAFLAFLHMGVSASKSLQLPPNTPKEIIDAYVKGVEKAMADPEFLKAAKAQMEYPQYIGKDAKAIMKLAVGMDPETKAWLKEWISTRFDVSL